jgi:hypothetical protein
MYKGGLKHFSIVAIPEQQKLIQTGGLSIATSHPVASVYEWTMSSIQKAHGNKNLIQKRFGHCSVFLRNKVVVFGGFAH